MKQMWKSTAKIFGRYLSSNPLQENDKSYVYFKIAEILNQLGSKAAFGYVGRPDRASPATGSIYRHKTEQTEVIEKVFTI